MEVALILGADPKICNLEGPKVNLIIGEWVIVTRGITDTKFALTVDGNPYPSDQKLFINKNTTVQTTIIERGNEKSIAILAERIGNVT